MHSLRSQSAAKPAAKTLAIPNFEPGARVTWSRTTVGTRRPQAVPAVVLSVAGGQATIRIAALRREQWHLQTCSVRVNRLVPRHRFVPEVDRADATGSI